MSEIKNSNLFSDSKMDLTLLHECSAPDILSRTHDFVISSKKIQGNAIEDTSQVSLVSDRTMLSSVCSADIISPHAAVEPLSPQYVEMLPTEGSALLARPVSKSKYRKFVNYCNHKAKKVMHRFKCAKKSIGQPNQHDEDVHNVSTMHRIHTPKMLHNFSRGVNHRSTPGGILQRRVILAGKTPGERTNRVAFLNDGIIEGRSAQIKRMAVNLREAADFLETL